MPHMNGDQGARSGAASADKDYWGAMTMDEACEMPPPDWLVRDILPEHGVGLLYALSGVGKSFLAADIAYAVLTGRPWHDKAVKQGMVYYVATEGFEAFGKRLNALRQHAGTPLEAPFRIVPKPVNLLDEGDVKRFIAYAKHTGDPIRLIVLDTLNRCMPGVADENSNAAMSAAVTGAKQIADETGAFVLLVHHTGRNGMNARGGYALECNTDARLRLGTKDTPALVPGGTVKLYNEKQRDDNKEPAMQLNAERVTLPDGSTSLVLVNGGKARIPRKDTAKQRQRILTLHDRGTPNGEIAAKLNIPVGTVSSTISRRKP